MCFDEGGTGSNGKGWHINMALGHNARNDDIPKHQRAQRERVGRYNKRPVQQLVTIHDLFLTLGGQRLDLLSVLARGPTTVTSLTERLFLPIWVVSRELAFLERRGLVTWVREKNFRWYRLSNRVRSVLKGEIVQLGIQVETGNWLIVHLNESGEPDDSTPPHQFIT